MPKYKIVVDSSCDLPFEYYKEHDISVTDLIINFNDRAYRDRVDITSDEILKLYEETKVFPKTSALNASDYTQFFKDMINEYDHIFYMPISSKVSSTINNAMLAVHDLHAEEKLTCLDSKSLSSGCALLAMGLVEDCKAGLSVDEIIANHNNRAKRISMSFVIDTLEFLHRGGRCSGLTFLLGNKFHIHPIITLDDGKMGVHTLVRDKDITKGVKKQIEEFKEQFKANNIDFNFPIFIPHVKGDAGVKRIVKELEGLVSETMLIPVDASGIITCHCGANTVGLAYVLKQPKK